MKNIRFDPIVALRFLGALAFAAAAAAAFADAPLRTATVQVGPNALRVEVVATDAQRARGLMQRKSLGRDAGMLFDYQAPSMATMWMKNTLIPLSVAFIDAQGTILNILDMEPQTLDSHMSAGPSIYAIEVNKGWFGAKKVQAGDKVTGLPKK